MKHVSLAFPFIPNVYQPTTASVLRRIEKWFLGLGDSNSPACHDQF